MKETNKKRISRGKRTEKRVALVVLLARRDFLVCPLRVCVCVCAHHRHHHRTPVQNRLSNENHVFFLRRGAAPLPRPLGKSRPLFLYRVRRTKLRVIDMRLRRASLHTHTPNEFSASKNSIERSLESLSLFQFCVCVSFCLTAQREPRRYRKETSKISPSSRAHR